MLFFEGLNENIYFENLVDLIDFRFSREQRLLGKELAKNAAHWPHVYGSGVLLRGEGQREVTQIIQTVCSPHFQRAAELIHSTVTAFCRAKCFTDVLFSWKRCLCSSNPANFSTSMLSIPLGAQPLLWEQGAGQASAWTLTLAPSSSSGDRYHRVTTIGVYGFRGEPYSRAKPKSPICGRTEMSQSPKNYQVSLLLKYFKRFLPHQKKLDEETFIFSVYFFFSTGL